MIALRLIEGRRLERLVCDECGFSRPVRSRTLEEPTRLLVVGGRELCGSCVWDLECAGYFGPQPATVERQAA